MALLVFEHHPLDNACRLGEILRDTGHKLETVRHHAGDTLPPDLDNVDGLVVMGGPMDLDEKEKYAWIEPELALIRAAHEAGLPIVGICLGAQLIAEALGGTVERMEKPEVGFEPITTSFFGTIDPMLAGLPWNSTMMHAHGCEVTQTPPGGTPLPLHSSSACKHQAFKVGMTTYAFQYHFEWDRQRILDFQAGFEDFFAKGGKTKADLERELDESYTMYRHLGDRLCQNLCDRLFPLDRRLPASQEVAANFHAHRS